MNEILRDYARSWIIEKLGLLRIRHKELFIRIYGKGVPCSTPINFTIASIVAIMSDADLNCAMMQIKRTLDKEVL